MKEAEKRDRLVKQMGITSNRYRRDLQLRIPTTRPLSLTDKKEKMSSVPADGGLEEFDDISDEE